MAHNVRFDYGFISATLEALGYGELLNRKLCTIDLARRTIVSPKYGLGALKEVLNIIMLMKNMENKRIMLIAALMNLAGNNNSVIEKDRKVLEGKNKSIHNVEQHIDKAISNNNKINVNVGKHKNEKKVIEESSIEKNDISSQNKILDKKEKLDMLAIRKYMLVNKEMKLFVLLNNIEIYVKENNAYLVSKMELSGDILTKENLKIIKDAIKNTTGKEYIVEYIKEK